MATDDATVKQLIYRVPKVTAQEKPTHDGRVQALRRVAVVPGWGIPVVEPPRIPGPCVLTRVARQRQARVGVAKRLDPRASTWPPKLARSAGPASGQNGTAVSVLRQVEIERVPTACGAVTHVWHIARQ